MAGDESVCLPFFGEMGWGTCNPLSSPSVVITGTDKRNDLTFVPTVDTEITLVYRDDTVFGV